MPFLAQSVSEPLPTADPAKSELLRSLARLVRGLSALFWGLPLTLITYVQTARTDWLELLGSLAILPPVATTALLFFGLSQLRYFQKQERVWIRAVDRAQMIAFINIGLSPFLYWWHRSPETPLFSVVILVLAFFSLLFLTTLNHVLHRLAAMLPDEALREETRLFTALNRGLLSAIPFLVGTYYLLGRLTSLPDLMIAILARLEPFGLWLVLFMLLMPLAMTMALIWKMKEVIFAAVFQSER